MSNTSVRAAAEGMPKINRRSILGGLAAATALVAANHADASPVEDSPIMALFRQWDTIFKAGWSVVDDDQCDFNCEQMRDLELQIMAIPAITARDFAAKLVAISSYGDFSICDGDEYASPVLDEAIALIGATRPPGRS